MRYLYNIIHSQLLLSVSGPQVLVRRRESSMVIPRLLSKTQSRGPADPTMALGIAIVGIVHQLNMRLSPGHRRCSWSMVNECLETPPVSYSWSGCVWVRYCFYDFTSMSFRPQGGLPRPVCLGRRVRRSRPVRNLQRLKNPNVRLSHTQTLHGTARTDYHRTTARGGDQRGLSGAAVLWQSHGASGICTSVRSSKVLFRVT